MRDARIVMKKSGFFFVETYNNEIIEEVMPHNFIGALSLITDIEPDVTLRDIMTHTSRNCKLLDFMQDYINCDLSVYDDILTGTYDKDENINSMEICYFQIVDREENKICDDIHFHGVGIATEKDEIDGTKAGDIMNYGIAGQIQGVLDCSVVLKAESSLFVENYDPETDHYGCSSETKANKDFTFLEILNAIYDEITFFGNPEKVEEFHEMLHERMEEAKREDASFRSWEEVSAELNEHSELRDALRSLVNNGEVDDKDFAQIWAMVEEKVGFEKELTFEKALEFEKDLTTYRLKKVYEDFKNDVISVAQIQNMLSAI